ncbi:MAG TPA: serine hydrolase domain-containing protein, partial [Paraburkholderia sp.]|uniref:serine hydrolase domain-containing protein n=1 Tax=Paraburkholderia sp. TaxID=1926495 RepID=UPI002B48E8F9
AGIDDPIRKFLPHLNRVCHDVSMRQLMSHVSGLRDSCDIRLRFSGHGGSPTPASELVAMYKDIEDTNAAPGTTWIYNNGAYVILSAVIEQITGQPLEQVLRERVFRPVGMYDTLVRSWDTDFLPNSARAHLQTPSGTYEAANWGLDWAGAGALVSSVDDMLRWLRHMDAPIMGTRATWIAMQQPFALANGTLTSYGLGLAIGEFRGFGTVYHNGGWLGGNAQMLKVPALGLDMIVIVNRGDLLASRFAERILEACLPGQEPARPQAGDSQLATGNYISPTSGRVIQLFAKQGEQIVSIDGVDLPYIWTADRVLRPFPSWAHIKRVVRITGNSAMPTSIQLDDFGDRDELIRTESGADAADAETLFGHYRSTATGTEAVIFGRADGGADLRIVGRFSTTLHSLHKVSDRIWNTSSPATTYYKLILSFDQERSMFRLTSGGTRALPFLRVAESTS